MVLSDTPLLDASDQDSHTSASCLAPSVFTLPSPCAALDSWAFLDEGGQFTPSTEMEKTPDLVPSIQHTLTDQSPAPSFADALIANHPTSATERQSNTVDSAPKTAAISKEPPTGTTSARPNQTLTASSKRKIAHSEVEKGRRQSISNGFAALQAILHPSDQSSKMMPKSMLLEQACDTIVDLQLKLKTSASIISNLPLDHKALSAAAPLLTSPTMAPYSSSRNQVPVDDTPAPAVPAKRARPSDDQEVTAYDSKSVPRDSGASSHLHDGARPHCRCGHTVASTSSGSPSRSSSSPEPSGITFPYIEQEKSVELQRALALLLTSLPAHVQKPKRRHSPTHTRSHSSSNIAASLARRHSHCDAGNEPTQPQPATHRHEEGCAAGGAGAASSSGLARSYGENRSNNGSHDTSASQQANEAAIARFMQAFPNFQF